MQNHRTELAQPIRTVTLGHADYSLPVRIYDVKTVMETYKGEIRAVSPTIFDDEGQMIGDTKFDIAAALITTKLVRCWKVYDYPIDQGSEEKIGKLAAMIYEDFGELPFGDIEKAFDNLAKGNYTTEDIEIDIKMETYGKMMNIQQVLALLRAQLQLRRKIIKAIKKYQKDIESGKVIRLTN